MSIQPGRACCSINMKYSATYHMFVKAFKDDRMWAVRKRSIRCNKSFCNNGAWCFLTSSFKTVESSTEAALSLWIQVELVWYIWPWIVAPSATRASISPCNQSGRHLSKQLVWPWDLDFQKGYCTSNACISMAVFKATDSRAGEHS